jgi:uncharacterized protein (TIGR02266 family)
MAAILEQSLRTSESEADRRNRALVVRVWTLFVPAYEDLCRVGRFVSGDMAHGIGFPPIAMIAAHRRAKRRATSLLPPEARTKANVGAAPTAEESVSVDDADVELVSTPPRAIEEDEHPPPLLPEPGAPLQTPSSTGATVAQPPPGGFSRASELAEAALAPPPSSLSPSAAMATRAASSPPGSTHRSFSPEAEVRPEVHAAGAADSSKGRRSERRMVQVEVGVFSQSNFYLGFTENVSAGGVFIATYCPRPIGSTLEIELHLPDGLLHVSGTVRWLRTTDACEDWPGMGVQFDDLSENDGRRIRDFVSVRDPLFFVE